MEKIALLSNVNVNFVNRKLKNHFEVYETEGYGNELGLLWNPDSSLKRFEPKAVFLLMDLAELVGHECQTERCGEILSEWFDSLKNAMEEKTLYFLSDAYLYSEERDVFPSDLTVFNLESLYQNRLQGLFERHSNVRIFPLRRLIADLGEERSFSWKTWYLGKILFSNELQGCIAQTVLKLMETEGRVPRKVLVLDLDNTLWGGLAGDYPAVDLELSEDHKGLYYKNAQRVIKKMKEAGVLLCIASKNNEEDVRKVFRECPHMVLSMEDFAAYRINWESKDVNIREMALELNLGLDSFVFWDDQPAERALIRELLPEVEVPEFPEDPGEMCGALRRLYDTYFRKLRTTKEDLEKTEAYAQNRERKKLEGNIQNFQEYLRNLKLCAERVDAADHMDRLQQLLNKTNQFNLTTVRYELSELKKKVEDPKKRVYLYRVEDRFGDYGLVAALILDLQNEPVITDFVMSCRVMGKRVEYAIISDIEAELREEGKKELYASYLPTAKNTPVKQLFEQLGYELIREEDGRKHYRISLENKEEREYFVAMKNGG